jgi:lysophospholipase L1-like esterase
MQKISLRCAMSSLKHLSKTVRSVLLMLGAALAAGCVMPNGAHHRESPSHWSTTWGASETVPAPDSAVFSDQTLRLIVHASSAGNQVRIKLSNLFGTRPLSIGGASVALRESGAILVAGSNRTLTFGGRNSIDIPIGAYVLSDAAPLSVLPQQDLAVSLFIGGDSGPATRHALALQTSFVSTRGNFVGRDDGRQFPTEIHDWPFLTAVEVSTTDSVRSIVAFGDSITDGYLSSADANHRWPDYLVSRLAAAHRRVAVVNEGIGGNRIWHNAIPDRSFFGPNGLSRFDRDAVNIAGATHIVVLLGINDIGQANPTSHPEEQVSAEDIIVGLQQFALRAHAGGIRIIAGTLTPYEGAAYFDIRGEKMREQVNAWIRSAGEFDGLIDFDAALRDPTAPTKMRVIYDSGDHLHPSDAGYKAMAEAVDLALFD